MATVSATISESGVSSSLFIRPGDSLTYSATFTDYEGSLVLERSKDNGISYDIVHTFSGADVSSQPLDNASGMYRFRAVITGGSVVVSMSDADLILYQVKDASGRPVIQVTEAGVSVDGTQSVSGAASVGGALTVTGEASSAGTTSVGVGAKNGATVSVVEYGNSVVHQSVLTLASTPVTVANTTGASFGGLKLYDFPAGRILALGCTANLSFVWTGTDIVADGSGDFSLGTTITADATLDTTDVDLLPSSAMLDPFVLGVGTGVGALAASAQFDGTSTAKDLNINIIIDDADVEDAASDIVLVSGTVTVSWINLGDY